MYFKSEILSRLNIFKYEFLANFISYMIVMRFSVEIICACKITSALNSVTHTPHNSQVENT